MSRVDRPCLNAIHCREPGGTPFEIATDPPGFAVDEPLEALGTRLMPPPQHEPRRERLERTLPPIRVPGAAEGA